MKTASGEVPQFYGEAVARGLFRLRSLDMVQAEIERLKEGDVLETTFAEFARNRQDLFLPLIDERDRYMAARLREDVGIRK